MGKMRSRMALGLVGVLAIGTVAVGVAYASGTISPNSPQNEYFGCVNTKSGTLRIVSSGTSCTKSESSMVLPGPQVPQNVSVDCATQTIQSALDAAPVNLPLNINITGTCDEAVNIDRDSVTLNGQGNASITPPSNQNAITVTDAKDVIITGLTLTGGSQGIQTFGNSSVRLGQVHIDDSTNTGIWINNGSAADLFEVQIDHAVNNGLFIWTGGSASVSKSSFENTTNGNGITVDGGHLLVLGGTQISSNSFNGVELTNGATADLNGITVSDSGATGVHVFNGSTAFIANFMSTRSLIEHNGVGSTGGRSGVTIQAGTANLMNTDVVDTSGFGIVNSQGGRLAMSNSTVSGSEMAGVDIVQSSTAWFPGGNDVHNNNKGVFIHDVSTASFSSSDIIENNTNEGLLCGDAQAMLTQPGSLPTMTGNGSDTSNCTTGS